MGAKASTLRRKQSRAGVQPELAGSRPGGKADAGAPEQVGRPIVAASAKRKGAAPGLLRSRNPGGCLRPRPCLPAIGKASSAGRIPEHWLPLRPVWELTFPHTQLRPPAQAGMRSSAASFSGRQYDGTPAVEARRAHSVPYLPAVAPLNESERMDALHATGVLCTPPDPRFDGITRLMCQILKVGVFVLLVVGVTDNRSARWSSSASQDLCTSYAHRKLAERAQEASSVAWRSPTTVHLADPQHPHLLLGLTLAPHLPFPP